MRLGAQNLHRTEDCSIHPSSSFPFAAVLPHQSHRFVDNFGGDIERRTETNRILARTQRENTKIEKAFPEFLARLRIWKIECEKQAPSARGGNDRLFALQIEELIEEISTHFACVLHEMLFLDDAQVMGRAHHIGEISAPGRIQPAG